MKAIESAIIKLKNSQHRADDESEHELTKNEIESLIAAAELLIILIGAIETK